MGKDIADWEYDEKFYNDADTPKVRSFEDILAECEENQEIPKIDEDHCDDIKLKEMADNIGKIKVLTSEGCNVTDISERLGLNPSFVSDVLITISGSPEDDSDMAIAYLMYFG